MHTNDANNANKLIYPKLSYLIVGTCIDVHNELGKFGKEKQYADLFEQKLKEAKILYKRELKIGESGNIVDFLIGKKILLELKAKRVITKKDYYQIQRYLQEAKVKLGILVNFRGNYIKPIRVIRIDTKNKSKFLN